MTTKQQEREALKKIRKIVDDLGEDSYLAAAFAGCFEDAAANIENDFALSMQGRWQYAEQQVEVMKIEIQGLEAAVETLKGEAALEREKSGRLNMKLAEIQKKVLPDWLYEKLWTLVTDEAAKSRQDMAASAETMAFYADCPTDTAFTSAVESYRRDKKKAEHCEWLAKALDEIAEEGAK